MAKQIASFRAFGGTLKKFTHPSKFTKTDMTFAVFSPPNQQAMSPVLYWLSGLTCTEENFMTKACALSHAARLGMTIVAPDTSPRGAGVPGEDEAYDFGSGAGFYVDATTPEWKENYNMYTYITHELPHVVESVANVDHARCGISGHSMGGHGALVMFLRNPHFYKSVSAFAPIVNPMNCPWGQKAFSGYLGGDKAAWKAYDATELLRTYKGALPTKILIDQGGADSFLTEQLKPENFVAAAKARNLQDKVEVRMQDGYDHSYYFIASFMQDHMEHHAAILN